MRFVFRSLALLSAMAFAACSRATPETAPVDAATAAAQPPATATAVALPDCADWAFIAQSIDTQWDALRNRSGLRCERIGAPGGDFIECAPDAGARLHGLEISSLVVNHPMGTDQLQADLTGDAQTVVQRLREVLGREADIVDPSDAGWVWINPHEDGHERRVQVYVGGREPPQLTCSIAAKSAPFAKSDESPPVYGTELIRALVRCEAVEFMQRDAAARKQALLGAGLRCELSPAGGITGLRCGLPPATRAWGDTVAETLRIVDRDGQRVGIVTLAADVGRVRAAIERELGMPMGTDADGVAVNDGGLDDMYRMRLLAQGKGRAELQCLYDAGDVAAAQSPDHAPDQDRAAHAGGPFHEDATQQDETPPGSIEGAIRYPDGDAPALRICALQGDGAIHRCVDTAAGAKTYRIERAPAGSYVVIAQARSGALRAGGHVQPVQCIRAPCPEMPAEVFVPGGGGVSGIDLNGFYDAREDFPALPSP